MLRRLVVALSLVAVATAVPSTAAAGPVTVSGAAGTYTTVRFDKPVALEASGRDIGLASASAGDFVGLALVGEGGAHWAVWSQGLVRSRPCVFGAPCDRADFPDLEGDTRGSAGEVVLPAGTYRVALLGRPKAQVRVSAFLPGLHGTLKTDRVGRLDVRDLGSELPKTADAQPRSESTYEPGNTATSVVGAVVRVDSRTSYRAYLDYCLTEGDSLFTTPFNTSCGGEGSTRMGSMQVSYYSCEQTSPVGLCVPGNADSDAFTVGFSAVLGKKAHVGISTDTRAVSSAVAVVGYALTL